VAAEHNSLRILLRNLAELAEQEDSPRVARWARNLLERGEFADSGTREPPRARAGKATSATKGRARRRKAVGM
jgi:hypothetical protein